MVTYDLFIKKYNECLNDTRLASKPVRGFNKDKSFNYNNWNGGDLNIIREFLANIDEYENKRYGDGFITINKYWKDDCNYCVIVVFRAAEDCIENYSYVLTWYKNRGRIDAFTINGDDINEDDYIYLLNEIEKAFGVDFSN